MKSVKLKTIVQLRNYAVLTIIITLTRLYDAQRNYDKRKSIEVITITYIT